MSQVLGLYCSSCRIPYLGWTCFTWVLGEWLTSTRICCGCIVLSTKRLVHFLLSKRVQISFIDTWGHYITILISEFLIGIIQCLTSRGKRWFLINFWFSNRLFSKLFLYLFSYGINFLIFLKFNKILPVYRELGYFF